MNGLIYKVRDYFSGIIELSKETNSDFIILPKILFENFSDPKGSDLDNETVTFRGVEGINNLVLNFSSSLLLWEEGS